MVTPACKIIALDGQTVDQMAAGEVVERPSSVAKELVENALDAGAARIQVSIEQGGLGALIVTDNGQGMHAEDAQRSILRHATSKLRTIDDLSHVRTMGFRGEALSSIASVSRLTVTTREPQTDAGTRVQVEGGEVVAVGPAGCPVGTTIAVRDLFYNVPARRKFMRSPATEQAHVLDALLRVILAARRGGLTVQTSGRTLLDVPDNPNLNDRAQLAFGRGVSLGVPIDLETDGILVSGMLTAGALARGETRRVWLFVNGRFVRDRSLQRAINAACAPAMGSLQPAVLLYVDMPPEDVDVNVHPQKLEVRFAQASRVHKAVTEAMQQAAGAYQRQALAHAENQPAPHVASYLSPKASQRAFRGATGSAWRLPAPKAAQPVWPAAERLPLRGSLDPVFVPSSDPAPTHLPGIEPPLQAAPVSPWQRLVPLGVAPEGYLCCRDGHALALVNLIAAERAVLHSLLDQGATPLAAQPQLMPPTWVPDDTQQPLVDDYLIETADSPSPWGVVIEAVGPGHYVVMALPEALAAMPPVAVAEGLMAALAKGQAGCHAAYTERRAAVVADWLAHVLATWQGPASGSAAVWGPRWLARLAKASIPTEAPILYTLAAEAIAKLPH